VALRVLHPKGDEYSREELEDIAVVPLAFALTAVRVRLRRLARALSYWTLGKKFAKAWNIGNELKIKT